MSILALADELERAAARATKKRAAETASAPPASRKKRSTSAKKRGKLTGAAKAEFLARMARGRKKKKG